MTRPQPGPPPAVPWVRAWLGGPRHDVYLAGAGGDEERALAVYEWNAQLGAALFRDLAHVEVALRNSYDAALSARWGGPGHWSAAGPVLFAPLYRRHGSGRVDINSKQRDALARAVVKAGGPGVPPGKVIAELMFGFWRYLSSAAHEKALWVPYLYPAFRAGTDRRTVDAAVGRLHDVRNRVAHHEHLLGTDVAGRYADCVLITELISTDLARHLQATTHVPDLLGSRP